MNCTMLMLQKLMQQVRQLNVKAIGGMLSELMRIDYAAKTGGGTVRGGLEKLIVRFSGGSHYGVRNEVFRSGA